jgi:alpha-1,6-mannosyltransferase
VAVFYGARSGGLRTYLEAKAACALRTGWFEHHVIVPGRREHHEQGRHELPAIRLAASNGYRLPVSGRRLAATLGTLEPDVVLLHDPYWRPIETIDLARRLGVPAVIVHHCSMGHAAASAPGPSRLYRPALRAWFARAYRHADAVMAATDTETDVGVPTTLRLRLGIDSAFRPRTEVARGAHVLYAGRLSREKGIFELLEAAARRGSAWQLRLIGAGPAGGALARRARRLGLAGRVSFDGFVSDRDALARQYAAAGCVVAPGRFETFGLAALEAAACAAPVVACSNAPSSRALGPLAATFEPGDVDGLARAIERALARTPDVDAARRLAAAHTWERAIAAELAQLRRLVIRTGRRRRPGAPGPARAACRSHRGALRRSRR